jgi:radical SAM-linked protein
VVARSADAPAQGGRELTDAWVGALAGSGLPIARSEGAAARPRISFGAPLPSGIAAEGELVDVVLTDRWPAWRVREALAGSLPVGWRLVDLTDVWLAGPPLGGRVAAADYRISLAPTPSASAPILRSACAGLLAEEHLPRMRAKGDGVVRYDLRPLLIDVRVEADGPPVVLVARTRFHPELGSGRPEEVLAALADRLATPLDAAEIVRERLVLAEDVETGPGSSRGR